MTRTALGIIPAAVALLLVVSSVQAKGPVEIEVSGGGLQETLKIDGMVTMEELYPLVPTSVDRDALEGEQPYTVTFVAVEEPAGERFPVFELEYYPATQDHPAAFNDRNGNFVSINWPWEAPTEVRRLLDDAGVVAASPASGGGESGGDGVPIWVLIPGAIAGLTLARAGGRYLLRRSPR